MINGDLFFRDMHPDIISQFIKAKTMLKELGCSVVSTTAWSLVVRVEAIPDGIPNTCVAGTYLAQYMNEHGWSNCDHHHSNIGDEAVYVSIPYNLSKV